MDSGSSAGLPPHSGRQVSTTRPVSVGVRYSQGMGRAPGDSGYGQRSSSFSIGGTSADHRNRSFRASSRTAMVDVQMSTSSIGPGQVGGTQGGTHGGTQGGTQGDSHVGTLWPTSQQQPPQQQQQRVHRRRGSTSSLSALSNSSGYNSHRGGDDPGLANQRGGGAGVHHGQTVRGSSGGGNSGRSARRP